MQFVTVTIIVFQALHLLDHIRAPFIQTVGYIDSTARQVAIFLDMTFH